MAFKVTALGMGLLVLEPDLFGDSRGSFMDAYKRSEFAKIGLDVEFEQDSQSGNRINVLRGLHYQRKPMEQGKLVRVANGKIFDVAVDLRLGSETFGGWFGVELSAKNKKLLWIPPGFAHGFVALEDNTDVVYKITKEYSKEHELGILWNDPGIGIEWPVSNPILSEKDRNARKLGEIKHMLS